MPKLRGVVGSGDARRFLGSDEIQAHERELGLPLAHDGAPPPDEAPPRERGPGQGIPCEGAAHEVRRAHLEVLLPRRVRVDALLVEQAHGLARVERGQHELDELRLDLVEEDERRRRARMRVPEERHRDVELVENASIKDRRANGLGGGSVVASCSRSM